ncbi:hypothetical protein L3Y34_000170 [Caenorhabditis briggsae]|uniref:Uncharacterized protein n=1 Tax=Caenorhabditis briggsae TaxID=6238 RepID=A0AAE9ILE0_CAEBR|nr:hypothetical protein L3Y34_000167 [Caenorhabditis briggsae]ULT98611.1 hypothetical protein L3Y34_000170 [Caenorhabditis briggsae]
MQNVLRLSYQYVWSECAIDVEPIEEPDISKGTSTNAYSASRVLYINLGNTDPNVNRSNMRADMHKLLTAPGKWMAPPGRGVGSRTSSQHYYRRTDGIEDGELAREVQRMIESTGHTAFEFAIFKPIYTDDREQNFEAFKRVFGTSE